MTALMKLKKKLCGIGIAKTVARGLSLLSAMITLFSTAFGAQPEFLFSKEDIERAKSNIKSAYIDQLPLEYYPLLAKFTQLRQISLYSADRTLATDEKLKSLARLNLTNLADITLLNCRRITDEGILALSTIRSLKSVQLEGTSISDKGLGVLATNTHVSGVNVANCNGVTLNGLQSLATSEFLEDVTFSARQLSNDDILKLFILFKHLKWCEIIDPSGRLDTATLKKTAADRGFRLLIKSTGALQDMENYK